MSDVTSRAWWRWMDGMRYRLSLRHPWCRYEGSDACDDDGSPVMEALPSQRSPIAEVDETDPATLGCLTQRARDLWGEPRLHLVPTITGGWRVAGFTRAADDVVGAHGPTEYAALLAACDAAPNLTTTKDTP